MRSLILIATFVAVSLPSLAKKVSGGFIKDGKTTETTFFIQVGLLMGEPNFERIQYKVKYLDENGKKKTLRPHDADEFWFDLDGMDVRMVSVENTLGLGNIFTSSPKIFLKIEIDGPLRLFRYYYKQTNTSMGAGGMGTTYTYTVDNLVFQKRGGPLMKPRSLMWKKDMLEYFGDCPALSERIESKDLKRRDIDEIVFYYNRNCGKK